MRLRFDFAESTGRRAPIEFAHPHRVIVATSIDEVWPAIRAVEDALAAGSYAAGFVAYEAAPAFDIALTTHRSPAVPLVWFGLFAAPTPATALDISADPASAESALDRPPRADGARPGGWTAAITDEEYQRGIDEVKSAIEAGDSYQANYTFRLHADLDVETLEARYLRLARDQGAPYAAWLDLERWRIVSLSPELFFRVHGRRITTRPMKGTAPRGRWLEEDAAQARWLASSAKNRAENVMIVDLARNDIGRIAEVGSVRASSLFDIERYPSVFQMVSAVEGDLRAGTTLGDIFAALFPAGSITGAPKTSSMRLLAAIEQAPRGVYCGAIGFATPGGDAVFNVAIRTAVVDARTGRAELGVGGGITWDSAASDERGEAWLKATFLDPLPAFDLLETMRMEQGSIVRIDRHIDRLRDSAAYFDFAFDRERVVRELVAHGRVHGPEPRRVRIRLSRSGVPHVESQLLDRPAVSPMRVALASAPVSRLERFLFHKTTNREVYEQHRLLRPDVSDVLLWNDVGELTEFPIGNVVVEIEGKRWTPPRDTGLLAGVFRGVLLERGDITERRLVVSDLSRATNIWLINSVREWVAVKLGEP
jgi:para-aminobenzoate synthetase / 4-amino-4-deoxychorismate lyase